MSHRTSPIRIIAYCPAGAPGVAGRTGSADYSYAFVLERFRPVLDTVGAVIEVHTEEQVRQAVLAAPDSPIVLSFAPVHRTPLDVGAPVVPVFAWEFDTLPRWTEDAVTIDWAQILSRCAAAITLSEHTRTVVRSCTTTPVWAIPAPVFDRFHPLRVAPTRGLTLPVRVIDSADLAAVATMSEIQWDGQPQEFTFGAEHLDTGRLVGFHRAEEWGCWSESAQVAIVLPFPVDGRVQLGFDCVGVGPNAGRTVTVRAATATAPLTLPTERARVTVRLDVAQPVSQLTITGLLPTRTGTAHDLRRLGMGLSGLRVERSPTWWEALRGRGNAPGPTSAPATQPLTLDGVVYTSVFNPADGRKDWRAMVTAFCSAFRDEPSATLVLKMTHRSLAAFVGPLLSALQESGPLQCRVLALHGYLTEVQLAELAAATDFYVNSSTGEGLCMPMMEFMSLGVPAIAPRHTAMAEYLTDANSLPVQWSLYPTCWPQDPSRRWRTHLCRVHWDSLREQFQASHELASGQPDRHRAMREDAIRTQREFSGDRAVGERLRHVMAAVIEAGP